MRYFDGLHFLLWGEHMEYGYPVAMRQGEYYSLGFNVSGEMEYAFEEGAPKRCVRGPWAWILPPGAWGEFRAPASQTRHHMYLIFKGERIEDYLHTGLLIPDPQPVHIRQPEQFRHHLTQLYDAVGPGCRFSPEFDYDRYGHESVKHDYPDQARATHLLEGLLLQLHRNREEGEEPERHQKILDIVESIRMEPEREWDFTELSHKLCLSYSHFRRLFHRAVGVPPWRHVVNCRLENAALLLRTGQTPIKEISLRAGMKNPQYLGRQFKAHYGITPLQYRRQFALQG